MKKTTLCLFFGTAVLSATALLTPSVSADTPSGPKPTTIKLGLFFPANGDLKDSVGKTWFSLGADYEFNKQGAASTSVPVAFLDYTGKGGSATFLAADGVNTITADVRFNVLGIGAGIRSYGEAQNSSSVRPYFGAGAGLYFLSDSGSLKSTDGTSISVSNHKTSLGAKLSAGLEFGSSYVAELSYVYPGKIDGSDLSGFNLQLGAKF